MSGAVRHALQTGSAIRAVLVSSTRQEQVCYSAGQALSVRDLPGYGSLRPEVTPPFKSTRAMVSFGQLPYIHEHHTLRRHHFKHQAIKRQCLSSSSHAQRTSLVPRPGSRCACSSSSELVARMWQSDLVGRTPVRGTAVWRSSRDPRSIGSASCLQTPGVVPGVNQLKKMGRRRSLIAEACLGLPGVL